MKRGFEPRPEVTVVAHDIGPVGGMERQLAELIGGLLDDDYAVTAIARTCRLPAHSRLRWVRVRGPARPFPLAYPWFLVAGSIAAGRHGCGLLHSTGAIVLNRTDVTTVHLCHHELARIPALRRATRASGLYRLNAGLAAWMSRLAERWHYGGGRAGRLVAVSAGVAEELRRHFPAMAGATVTVANGVDTDRFSPAIGRGPATRSEPASLTAIFVGSEWEGKGLAYALEAVAGLPGWRLLVVGAGDRGRYEAMARRLGVASRVLFEGVCEDVGPLYRAADAFLLPSAYESFSLVTYEAAASGLPLLVTRVSGVEDLLEDSRNGWFIGRDAADIRARLQALGDRRLRETMGKAARRASLEFSWRRMVDGYERIYRESGPLLPAPSGNGRSPSRSRDSTNAHT